MRYSHVFIGGIGSLNRLVLGDHVLRLGRRRRVRLTCPGGEYVLFEEALADKFFQISPEASTVCIIVSLTVVIRTVIFCSSKCRVIFDWLRAPYPWLVLDGTEYFINRELQPGEVLFRPKGSKWIWRENRERLLLKTGCLRFSLSWVRVSGCEFVFSPSLSRLRN